MKIIVLRRYASVRLLAAMILVLLSWSSAHAAKTDVVVIINGDHVTGEIKQLSLGKLKYSTDDMGTIYIEWDKVEKLWSNHRFEIRTQKGDRHIGTLEEPSEAGVLVIAGSQDTTSLPIISVVEINQMDLTFWSRFSYDISLGFSYAKANKDTWINLGSNIKYRSERYAGRLSANGQVSNQDDSDETKRADLSLHISRFRGHRWLMIGLADLEHNDELGLELRWTAGGGAGYYVIRTNRLVLSPYAGLVLSGDRYLDDTEAVLTTELLTGARFELFQYDHPKTSIEVYAELYLALLEFDRTRFSLNSRLKIELVSDLFWSLQFYDDYNSEGSDTSDSKNDFGVTTSIGWSFN
jgi:hypothetical protein